MLRLKREVALNTSLIYPPNKPCLHESIHTIKRRLERNTKLIHKVNYLNVMVRSILLAWVFFLLKLIHIQFVADLVNLAIPTIGGDLSWDLTDLTLQFLFSSTAYGKVSSE